MEAYWNGTEAAHRRVMMKAAGGVPVEFVSRVHNYDGLGMVASCDNHAKK